MIEDGRVRKVPPERLNAAAPRSILRPCRQPSAYRIHLLWEAQLKGLVANRDANVCGLHIKVDLRCVQVLVTRKVELERLRMEKKKKKA